jgi:hypothetical protein
MSWRRFIALFRNLPAESILVQHLVNMKFEDLPIETEEEALAWLKMQGL